MHNPWHNLLPVIEMETADTIELSGNTSRKEDNIMATPDFLFPADA